MNKMRNYIGLGTTFHDPSVAIVNEFGEVVFAEASERYLQSKLAITMNGMPVERLIDLIKEYCTPGAEIVVAHTWSEGNLDWLYECDKTLSSAENELIKHKEYASFYQHRDSAQLRFMLDSQISTTESAETKLRYALSRIGGEHEDSTLCSRYYDHHLNHAAAACYTSAMDDAVCLVIDGEGEYYQSTALYHYVGGKIERLFPQPNIAETVRENTDLHHFSIGRFFSMVTQACGFGVLTGEEWKVMGLAPYGKVNEELYQKFKQHMVVEGVCIKPIDQAQLLKVFELFASVERKPEQSVWDTVDLAATGQKVFEDCVFEMIANAHALCPSKNIILGGGCALNSTVNGRIVDNTPFEKLHVYSAPADDGNALGAALLAYNEDNPQKAASKKVVMSPYLGSSISKKSVKRVKQLSGMKFTSAKGTVAKQTAELLAAGKIIGWVQGRAEFGPRALGNRSILADPRDENVKDKINSLVKFREGFRPFAPSILHEYGERFFKNYQESPYMERTLEFSELAKDLIPGVVHINNTGRLQSVKKEWNEVYYQLISEFYKLTDVPVLLNTSFNVMGKPIVHSIEDAIAVFYSSGIDALVIGDEIIQK